jgi:hypothetical protein
MFLQKSLSDHFRCPRIAAVLASIKLGRNKKTIDGKAMGSVSAR